MANYNGPSNTSSNKGNTNTPYAPTTTGSKVNVSSKPKKKGGKTKTGTGGDDCGKC